MHIACQHKDVQYSLSFVRCLTMQPPRLEAAPGRLGSMARAVFLVLILCLSAAFELANAQELLDITVPAAGAGLTLSQATALGARYSSPAECEQSAKADIPRRAQLPETTSGRSSGSSTWGPPARRYPQLPAAAVPPGCNPAAWAMSRVLAIVEYYVSLGLNYCHHHVPGWAPPAAAQTACSVDNSAPTQAAPTPGTTCSCAQAGLTSRSRPWSGLDCSNFSAWVYNFGFGLKFTGAIGAQACNPQEAPGRVLPLRSAARPQDQALLKPGDLVYISVTRTKPDQVLRVSHVVLWTGLQMDTSPNATGPLSRAALLANLPDNQKRSAAAYMDRAAATGQPVYVIADSHYTGPNYRPFAGWYVTAFSHARRIISPGQQLPASNTTLARFEDGKCWAQPRA